MGFCDYLKEIELKCTPCYENGVGACHVKLGLQEYWPEAFQLYDTIQIIRHDHRITIETDIEVKYHTKYPYGMFAGKGAEFAAEYAKKDKEIKDYLEDKVPDGVRLLSSHQHYNPDKHDPNIVAVHIHAHKQVEDLDDAKLVVEKLAKVIRPPDIEPILKTD